MAQQQQQEWQTQETENDSELTPRPRRSGRVDANKSGHVKSPARTEMKSHKQMSRWKDGARQKGQGWAPSFLQTAKQSFWKSSPWREFFQKLEGRRPNCREEKLR